MYFQTVLNFIYTFVLRISVYKPIIVGGQKTEMRHHSGPGGAAAGADRADSDEDAEDAARSPGQDIRYALGLRQPEPRVGQPGREADCVGLVLDQQGARHPSEVLLGHDLCLRPQW